MRRRSDSLGTSSPWRRLSCRLGLASAPDHAHSIHVSTASDRKHHTYIILQPRLIQAYAAAG